MKVKFYGTGSAIPSPDRGFACIGIRGQNSELLLDCGDGSIHRLIKSGVDINGISSILITHFHSDHLTGLTSIIETMDIQKRNDKLTVYGLPGLNDYFSSVRRTTNVAFNRKFEIEIKEILPNQRLLMDEFTVSTFEMDHTLPCIAYRIESRDAVLAYTGDTQPCSGVFELAKDVDLLIHEATFLKKDIEKARRSKHSTPGEAAIVALDSKAKRLVMTHVNDSQETPDEMLDEAKPSFKDSIIASDGLEIVV